MLRKRLIPVLLQKNKGLVKGIKFDNYKYIGDPINAIKILNDKQVDELVYLDIDATKENRVIDVEIVKTIADECYMPFAVGGGISKISEISKLLSAGAEKVVINSSTITNPNLIPQAVIEFGSQSIIATIDIKINWFGKHVVTYSSGKKRTNLNLFDFAVELERKGVGEIMLNCVYADGVMNGYDYKIIQKLSEKVSIPVIACGGAGKLEHVKHLFSSTNVSAAASGSLFVFHGNRDSILINYPSIQQRKKLEII